MKNRNLVELIANIKKTAIEQKSKFWKRVATDLDKPSRRRRVVNTEHIAKNIKKGETAVVPGKVVGNSKVDAKIVAFQFSASAREKNDATTIRKFLEENPKPKKVRIIG